VFKLCAYLILIFGDIPAMSLVMRMKDHNGLSPCHICKITDGHDRTNSKNNSFYFPLDCSNHPDVLSGPTLPCTFDPAVLPMRDHNEMIQLGRDIDAMRAAKRGKGAIESASSKHGIKGVTLLASLPLVNLATTCPYDFMHLIWENLIMNLVLHWTGAFRGLNEGLRLLQLEQVCLGRHWCYYHLGRINNSRQELVVLDSLSAPALLDRKFWDVKYYDHFIRLMKLLHICIWFEITHTEVQIIHKGTPNGQVVP
ncbi:hypothetical protein PENSPDRAFT_594608, partial [Peniophora sp. CONT]